MKGEPIVILLVEDDPAHIEIIKRTFEESRLANRLISVEDGQVALDYLHRKGKYNDEAKFPMPNLILLDLRLPKIDGLEVLKIIKTDTKLSAIPVVILTTSSTESDMVKAYEWHANSYLVKPVDFTQFNKLMNTFGYYWVVWNQYPIDP
ncbi:MAG: response regulator [Dehalococcoidales bacterium]